MFPVLVGGTEVDYVISQVVYIVNNPFTLEVDHLPVLSRHRPHSLVEGPFNASLGYIRASSRAVCALVVSTVLVGVHRLQSRSALFRFG